MSNFPPAQLAEIRADSNGGLVGVSKAKVRELISHVDALAAKLAAHELNSVTLAKVLLTEFGGPTQNEGAVEMAIRVLREQRAKLTALTAPCAVRQRGEPDALTDIATATVGEIGA